MQAQTEQTQPERIRPDYIYDIPSTGPLSSTGADTRGAVRKALGFGIGLALGLVAACFLLGVGAHRTVQSGASHSTSATHAFDQARPAAAPTDAAPTDKIPSPK